MLFLVTLPAVPKQIVCFFKQGSCVTFGAMRHLLHIICVSFINDASVNFGFVEGDILRIVPC